MMMFSDIFLRVTLKTSRRWQALSRLFPSLASLLCLDHLHSSNCISSFALTVFRWPSRRTRASRRSCCRGSKGSSLALFFARVGQTALPSKPVEAANPGLADSVLLCFVTHFEARVGRNPLPGWRMQGLVLLR